MIRTLVAVLTLLWAATSFAAGPVEEVDVNSASVASLDGLRGVGPALSARILAARQEGPFKDWADLMRRVKGIGARSAARLSAEGLTVNGVPFGDPLSKQ